MDMHAEAPEPTLLLTAVPIPEGTPKLAAVGRLPIMAFVDAETERVLQESASLLGRCVIIRGGIKKAIATFTEERSPHFLIVDISGVEMPLSQIYALADVCEPGTNVVALGDHNDVALYRDLVAAGVNDYVVKPLTRELLSNILEPRTNSDNRSGLKLGKAISFIGARGGVGTTTLAANVAWHLANRQSRRVALVDLDLYNGDCAMLFNLENNPGFRDALQNPLRLDALLLDRIMTQVGERLFVLGSEEPLGDNLKITGSTIDTLFSVLRSQFHYIVVDVPRTPSPAYHRALEIANRRVIVVDQTMRSMRDAVRISKLFETDDEGEKPIDPRNIFVVNRVGEARQHGLGSKDIQKVLQVAPTAEIPFLPKTIVPAAHHALVAATKRGKFAEAVAAIAVEISGRKERRKWWPWRAK